MAIRRVAGAPIEVLPDPIATRLLLDGGAIPANGWSAQAPRELQHVDEGVEVHGLTDRDPEFFEKQSEREAAATIERGLDGPPVNRMERGHRRKNR